jgi:hypothetical protein
MRVHARKMKTTGKNTKSPKATGVLPSRPLIPQNFAEFIFSTRNRIAVPRSKVITLGADHIHNFTSNPDRSHNGIKHGFLTLNV